MDVNVTEGTADAPVGGAPVLPIANVFKSTYEWFMSKVHGGKSMQPLFIQKGATPDAQWRVFLVYSNAFKDNTSETIMEAAHKEYADWATANGVYPELQLWHAGPGSRWGQVDFLAYSNGFAVSSGLVDKGKEHIATALEGEAKQGKLKVSHGYWGLKSADGTYLLYRDFEQSPLPAKAEANSWTGIGFDVFAAKESDMAFDPAKRQWLKDIAGMDDKGIDTWETSLKQAETSLANAGIARKEADPATEAGAAAGATAGETPAAAVAPATAATDPLLQVVAQMKEIGSTIGNVMTVVSANKADVDSKIGKIADAVNVIAAQVKKSQDDIVVDAYKSLAARAGNGHVASEVAGSSVAVQAAKEAPAGDWFGDVVLKDFKNVGDEAATMPQAPLPTLEGAGMGVQVAGGVNGS